MQTDKRSGDLGGRTSERARERRHAGERSIRFFLGAKDATRTFRGESCGGASATAISHQVSSIMKGGGEMLQRPVGGLHYSTTALHTTTKY